MVTQSVEQARAQEIPEIQVTERVQDLIIPKRIEEVRLKLFAAEETTQSMAEFSDNAPGRVFQHATSTDVVSYVASAASDAPTPARAVLDEWIAHMFFEGETPAERRMLRREAQEASAEQAAQELLADEVATKPKKGKHKIDSVGSITSAILDSMDYRAHDDGIDSFCRRSLPTKLLHLT